MSDIKAKKRLTDQQRDNYRWMLIQPFMSIDGYSMASLTDGQEKSLLRLSEALPSLFAYLDNTPDSSKDLIKLSEVLSDFFLSSYMKSSRSSPARAADSIRNCWRSRPISRRL